MSMVAVDHSLIVLLAFSEYVANRTPCSEIWRPIHSSSIKTKETVTESQRMGKTSRGNGF